MKILGLENSVLNTSNTPVDQVSDFSESLQISSQNSTNAGDDAAIVSISSGTNTDSTLSAAQTAALTEQNSRAISSIVDLRKQQRTLVEQASTATDQNTRDAIQTEIAAIQSEIEAISQEQNALGESVLSGGSEASSLATDLNIDISTPEAARASSQLLREEIAIASQTASSSERFSASAQNTLESLAAADTSSQTTDRPSEATMQALAQNIATQITTSAQQGVQLSTLLAGQQRLSPTQVSNLLSD